jgi:hypothetical protein
LLISRGEQSRRRVWRPNETQRQAFGTGFWRYLLLAHQCDVVQLDSNKFGNVAALAGFQEREFAIGDLWVRAGYRQALPVVKAYRGDSSYSFRKRLGNASRAVVSTSTVPLEVATTAKFSVRTGGAGRFGRSCIQARKHQVAHPVPL